MALPPNMAISGNKGGASQIRPAAWQNLGEIISPLNKGELRQLEQFKAVLAEVWPLKPVHRESLAADIAELSRQLTSQRSLMSRPYWSKPALISAYLYYFLPWNIIRLGRLLKNLPLPTPEISNGRLPALIDAGSGPLTLPLALWLAKPEWRAAKLRIIAIDKAKQALELGKRLLYLWAAQSNETAWPVSLQTGSIYALPELLRKTPDRNFWPWLLAAANTLNEPAAGKKMGQSIFAVEDEDPAAGTACSLLESWAPIWQRQDMPVTHLLFVEPGTRLGGTTIMNLRQCGLEMGLMPLSPCTHADRCPLACFAGPKSSYQKTWCHFTFAVDQAPGWLMKISRESGLEKASLSISALLMTTRADAIPDVNLVRVISRPFEVTDIGQNCRYGCAAGALLLLTHSDCLANGALTLAEQTGQRDAKSGARVATPNERIRSISGKSSHKTRHHQRYR